LAERQLLSVTINSRTVPGAELLDCRRHRQRIAEARQFGMFLARTVLRLSQTRAGLIFGRDRTTIRHACRQVIARGQADPRLMTQLGPALDIWAHRFATIAGTERSEP
jgi:chromosomal replication initiation ATPase DnaA